MIVTGPNGPGGWCPLVDTPTPDHYRQRPAGPITPLAAAIVTSDWHVCDQNSPARLEYLDRFFDPDNPHRVLVGPVGTYRPQEFLTRQVADSFVRVANSVRHGPTWSRPIDGVVITGDVIDNGQRNELADFLTLVVGGSFDYRDLSHWVGGEASLFDEHYWHPENQSRTVVDRPTRMFGYPHVPGLLSAAEAAFTTPGLIHPWFAVHGNHDALLQGTVAATDLLNELATGIHRIVGVSADTRWSDILPAIGKIGPAAYIHSLAFPTEHAPSDPSRHVVEVGEFRRAMAQAGGLPAGHGFGGQHPDDTTNYFVTDIGELVLVALDTVNPHGGYEGSVGVEQLVWLADTLAAHRDRQVVVASHHPPSSITNGYHPAEEEQRALGEAILTTLHTAGNVVTWLTGHEHRHAAHLHVGPRGTVIPEISTASLIDWPQQGRVVEWGLDSSGRLVIASNVLDHSGAIVPDAASNGIDYLSSWSRLLSANDYQRRDLILAIERSAGYNSDRNFIVTLPASRVG